MGRRAGSGAGFCEAGSHPRWTRDLILSESDPLATGAPHVINELGRGTARVAGVEQGEQRVKHHYQ